MVQELDWAKLDWTYTGYSVGAPALGRLDPHDNGRSGAGLPGGRMPKGEGAYFQREKESGHGM